MWLVLVLFISGLLLSLAIYLFTATIFNNPILARTNINNRPVATAGGLVFLLALIPLWLAVGIEQQMHWQLLSESYVASTLIASATLGLFGLLGLIDDVLGTSVERGFRGHLGALAEGRLSTGALKLLGGGLGALALVATLGEASWWRVLIGGATVALAANLANLFDRAPGRVTKVTTVSFALALGLGVATAGWMLPAPASAWGATALILGMNWGLFRPEVRELVMLGDTGANPAGAVLGLLVALVANLWVLSGVAVFLLAMNLVSERISFSKLINNSRLLRRLDMLGRRS